MLLPVWVLCPQLEQVLKNCSTIESLTISLDEASRISFANWSTLKELTLTVNDENGHANGDLALRTVAAVLQAEMPKDWIISRFGGDEFLVGGRVIDDEINIDEICASVERRRRERTSAY